MLSDHGLDAQQYVQPDVSLAGACETPLNFFVGRIKEENVKAIWNGEVIAESDDTVVIEGNHYFPIDSVNRSYLTESSTTSVCPWKGTANYYSLNVNGETNADAAWYYADPKPAASEITGSVAFWRGVQVAES